MAQRVPELQQLVGAIEHEHRKAPVANKLDAAVRMADELLDQYVQAARDGDRSPQGLLAMTPRSKRALEASLAP